MANNINERERARESHPKSLTPHRCHSERRSVCYSKQYYFITTLYIPNDGRVVSVVLANRTTTSSVFIFIFSQLPGRDLNPKRSVLNTKTTNAVEACFRGSQDKLAPQIDNVV